MLIGYSFDEIVGRDVKILKLQALHPNHPGVTARSRYPIMSVVATNLPYLANIRIAL